jgi:hypothetical protein
MVTIVTSEVHHRMGRVYTNGSVWVCSVKCMLALPLYLLECRKLSIMLSCRMGSGKVKIYGGIVSKMFIH